MAFNRKSLVRLAILSSILGLNGFCDVANALEYPEIKIHTPEADAKADEKADEKEECPICLADLADDSTDKLVTPCGHVFCKACISVWLNKRAHCPMCRTTLRAKNLKNYVGKDPVKEKDPAKEIDTNVDDVKLTKKVSTCPVCYTSTYLVAFPKCTHAACAYCLCKLNRCPVCREGEGFAELRKKVEEKKEKVNERVKELQQPRDQELKNILFDPAIADVKPLDNETKHEIESWLDRQKNSSALNGFDSYDKYEEALNKIYDPRNDDVAMEDLLIPQTKEVIQNRDAFDAYEKAVFSTIWTDDLKEDNNLVDLYDKAIN